MLLCLIFAWVVIFAIIMRGIQSSGKVVYFTALFPYVVMTIFFIRGLTLKGAGAGLAHMFLPKMDSLLKPTVWLDAATQVWNPLLSLHNYIIHKSYDRRLKAKDWVL